MNNAQSFAAKSTCLVKDYLELCKVKVVALMLVTALVGMLLASPTVPNFGLIFIACLGIALDAFSAAAINHVIDRQIDIKMHRTSHRPVATGKIEPLNATLFAIALAILGTAILYFLVNPLTALLSLITLLGYAVFYTMFLKRATPQNIVIGGAAGAAPPLLGWAAITNTIDPYALLLVLIIFTWTPPHFWALAIYRKEEYKKANIPMLSVTHGIKFTKLSILLYTLLLTIVTLLPYLTGMSGLIYLIFTIILNAIFIKDAINLYKDNNLLYALKTFKYSIIYLLVLFIALLFDHYLWF